MAKSLQFKRSSPPDCNWMVQENSEGDHDVPPLQRFSFLVIRQFGSRPAVDAPRHLVEPSTFDVLAPEGTRIAVTFQPRRVDDQPLGQDVLDRV